MTDLAYRPRSVLDVCCFLLALARGRIEQERLLVELLAIHASLARRREWS